MGPLAAWIQKQGMILTVTKQVEMCSVCLKKRRFLYPSGNIEEEDVKVEKEGDVPYKGIIYFVVGVVGVVIAWFTL